MEGIVSPPLESLRACDGYSGCTGAGPYRRSYRFATECVFGAGKTRSAAILVVGLLVFEPDLKLMILTKENVAAQALSEHIASFGLPESVPAKIGRLVG